MKRCTHTDQIHDVQPSAQGCEECLQMGDSWVPQGVSRLRAYRMLRFIKE